jgi:RNA polymerase sigma-70 factor (ECF subfamily)
LKLATSGELDESGLIERARRGDREAFGRLVERYQRRVVGVAFSVVHNHEDALEIAQEAFVKAFANLKQFESRSSFSTWLHRITANLAIDFRRREGRHLVLRGEDAEHELEKIPSGRGDLFKAAERGEINERLRQALDELTPEHRTVILLREVEGLSYDEISAIVDCPRGTIMSRLHYARTRLRSLLKDLGPS